MGAAQETAGKGEGGTIAVDPAPAFELSPYLYMQFMEPLGATDGSVEAAWDHVRGAWREDVVEVTKELAPPMMRWGGIFADYYRWREGVGPRNARNRSSIFSGAASSRTRSAPASSSTSAGRSAPIRSCA